MSSSLSDGSENVHEINFGITPTMAFSDVSALMVGEVIETLSNATYDWRVDSSIRISAAALNAMITDTNVTDGNPTDVSALTLVTGAGTDLAADDVEVYSGDSALGRLDLSFQKLAENSVKATLAQALTGSYGGDIGVLENDDSLSGVSLIGDNASVALGLGSAIRTAINSNKAAVLNAAEQILRDMELSDADGGGVDPSSPFTVAGYYPSLDFNLAVGMGDVAVTFDGVTAPDNTNSGATFFTDPIVSTQIGRSTASFSNNEKITDTQSNIYFSIDRSSSAVAAHPAGDADTDLRNGYIFIRLRATVND